MQRVILVAAIAFTTAAPVAAQVTSTFSASAEGWNAVDVSLSGPYDVLTGGPYSVMHSTPGGNPGGFIGLSDTVNGDGVYYFQAPAAFLGDQSAFYAGNLTFSTRPTYTSPAIPYVDADVILIGGGLTLVADAGPEPIPGVWTSYTVPLSEVVFRKDSLAGAVPTPAEVQTVLSNLTALRIRGEYGNGDDAGALDSVILMVPEPSTTASAVLAAASLPLRRRRGRG